jgi:hypothetical protein
MVPRHRFANALTAVILASAGALIPAAPAHATVQTVLNCPSSGIDGNNDGTFNGFYVGSLAASNINTVTLYYSADNDGEYTITLTLQSGSFGGPIVGMHTQTVNLSSTALTTVTWNFGGATFPSGQAAAFSHTIGAGPVGGQVNFNLQPTLCGSDIETVNTANPPQSNGLSVATIITENVSSGGTGCVANATTLCIDDIPGDKRFQITSTFATSQSGGESGSGHAIPLSSLGVTEGGLFWFFAANNPEMLIKVINGCSVTNHFWVFYSAGTNVGFTVVVTDTKNSHTATYRNTDLTEAPPVADTSALACP